VRIVGVDASQEFDVNVVEHSDLLGVRLQAKRHLLAALGELGLVFAPQFLQNERALSSLMLETGFTIIALLVQFVQTCFVLEPEQQALFLIEHGVQVDLKFLELAH